MIDDGKIARLFSLEGKGAWIFLFQVRLQLCEDVETETYE